jgi:phytoene synthase
VNASRALLLPARDRRDGAAGLAPAQPKRGKDRQPSEVFHNDVVWRQPDLLWRGRREAKRVLARGSKSFALAGALLGRRKRDDAAVLYAWCRIVDDRIDDTGTDAQDRVAHELDALERELEDVYAGHAKNPLGAALAELVARRRIPREYFQALLDGFAMDARRARYTSVEELDLYGFRVAGVVGLMMCHVLGVQDERCLRAAARLGMAMQLTNIARDVAEDFERGRQYLPSAWLQADDLSAAMATSDAHSTSRRRVAEAVQTLLARADEHYRAGLAGLDGLAGRDALAIGAAAHIYRAIGQRLARRGFDPLVGRAVVELPRKLWLAVRAGLSLLRRLPARLRLGRRICQVPEVVVRWDNVRA